MWHTTSSGHHRTLSAAVWIVAALWGVAGVITMTALDGGLTRGALLLAIVITEWWLVSQLEDHFEGHAGTFAAPTDQRVLEVVSVHASSVGPRAA
jgi:hypothetical protein